MVRWVSFAQDPDRTVSGAQCKVASVLGVSTPKPNTTHDTKILARIAGVS